MSRPPVSLPILQEGGWLQGPQLHFWGPDVLPLLGDHKGRSLLGSCRWTGTWAGPPPDLGAPAGPGLLAVKLGLPLQALATRASGQVPGPSGPQGLNTVAGKPA